MPVNKPFKTAIQKIKNDFGIKQDAVAGRLGITGTYLSDMINGRVPVTEKVSRNISELFHINIEQSEIQNNLQGIDVFDKRLCEMFRNEEIFPASVVHKKNDLIHSLYEEIGGLKVKIADLEALKAKHEAQIRDLESGRASSA